jgi:hypothetical protein
VTDWAVVFLGVIAAATLVMACLQVGAVIAAARAGRRAQQALGMAQQTLGTAQQAIASLRDDLRPLVRQATAIADEAAKSASLATQQIEKIDRLVTDVSRRVDETTAVVQQAIVSPARQGIALLAAVKAAFAVLRHGSDPRGRASRTEEEDPLFIG